MVVQHNTISTAKRRRCRQRDICTAIRELTVAAGGGVRRDNPVLCRRDGQADAEQTAGDYLYVVPLQRGAGRTCRQQVIEGAPEGAAK